MNQGVVQAGMAMIDQRISELQAAQGNSGRNQPETSPRRLVAIPPGRGSHGDSRSGWFEEQADRRFQPGGRVPGGFQPEGVTSRRAV